MELWHTQFEMWQSRADKGELEAAQRVQQLKRERPFRELQDDVAQLPTQPHARTLTTRGRTDDEPRISYRPQLAARVRHHDDLSLGQAAEAARLLVQNDLDPRLRQVLSLPATRIWRFRWDPEARGVAVFDTASTNIKPFLLRKWLATALEKYAQHERQRVALKKQKLDPTTPESKTTLADHLQRVVQDLRALLTPHLEQHAFLRWIHRDTPPEHRENQQLLNLLLWSCMGPMRRCLLCERVDPELNRGGRDNICFSCAYATRSPEHTFLFRNLLLAHENHYCHHCACWVRGAALSPVKQTKPVMCAECLVNMCTLKGDEKTHEVTCVAPRGSRTSCLLVHLGFTGIHQRADVPPLKIGCHDPAFRYLQKAFHHLLMGRHPPQF